MEVDRGLESFFVAEAASIALEFLDHGIKSLRSGIGDTGDDCGQDAVHVSLDRSGDLLDRLKAGAVNCELCVSN